MSQQINRIEQKDVQYLSDEAERHTLQLRDYQQVVSKSAVYPGQGSFLGLIYTVGKMVGEAGELNEKVQKYMRDAGVIQQVTRYSDETLNKTIVHFNDDHMHDSQWRDKIIGELGDILWYWVVTCKELRIEVDDVMIANAMKLYDRQERGVLQGSGDNR